MTAWIGWLVPGVRAAVLIVTLVLNERRVRAQRTIIARERRAVPTGVVAGYAIVSAVRWLGIVMLIAVIVALAQGRGLRGTWWTFAVIALALAVGGALGVRHLEAAVRRARDPFSWADSMPTSLRLAHRRSSAVFPPCG